MREDLLDRRVGHNLLESGPPDSSRTQNVHMREPETVADQVPVRVDEKIFSLIRVDQRRFNIESQHSRSHGIIERSKDPKIRALRIQFHPVDAIQLQLAQRRIERDRRNASLPVRDEVVMERVVVDGREVWLQCAGTVRIIGQIELDFSLQGIACDGLIEDEPAMKLTAYRVCHIPQIGIETYIDGLRGDRLLNLRRAACSADVDQDGMELTRRNQI